MRVRILELRLLACLLSAMWAVVGLAIVLGYDPGGPADIVVRVTALLPALIAAASIRWPPVVRSDRGASAVGWLGIVSALFLAPSILMLVDALGSRDRQTLLPSAEVAYAAVLALATTCLFSGLGLARPLASRSPPESGSAGGTGSARRRIAVGASVGAMLTLFSATSFGAATLANEAALRRASVATSPWGPTDPRLAPPRCSTGVELGAHGRVDARARAVVDGAEIGSATLAGGRNGNEEHWDARVATTGRSERLTYSDSAGSHGVGPRVRRGEGDWQRLEKRTGFGSFLDGAVVDHGLGRGVPPVVEDLGVELIGGARARHCRTPVNGPTALNAFLPLRLLIAIDPFAPTSALPEWRGELDYWIFADGQLGLAVAQVSGLPGEVWPTGGLQGSLEVRLSVLDRDTPFPVASELPR